jgi:hypothetical protein
LSGDEDFRVLPKVVMHRSRATTTGTDDEKIG